MKVLILYFSATGNTRLGVELIRAGIEKTPDNRCDCLDIKEYDETRLEGYDLIGFASPVFWFKPPLNMLALLERLPEGHGRPVFTFVSYAGDLSNVYWIYKDRLEKRGYAVIAQKEMLGQDSWTVARVPGHLRMENEPSMQTQASVLAFGQELQAHLAHFKAGAAVAAPKFHWNAATHAISCFYNDVTLRHLFITRVNAGACTRCGRCVRGCPTGKMQFESFPNPKGACIGCFRCINQCPENAIEGLFTRGKLRYRGPQQAVGAEADGLALET